MASTATDATARPDTRDMVIVHRVFRREFRYAAAIVRAVRDGDTARAELVAARFDELATALHHHHAGEDELLWPRLQGRADVDSALVAAMQQQHARVGELLTQALEALAPWRRAADVATRDRLAGLLDDVSAALDEHLAQEERDVLPLAAQHLTVAEWDELGERGMASIPRDRLLVFLGHILEETSPAERRYMLGHVPLPGRIAYRLVGHRQWRREIAVLRAGVRVPEQRRAD